MEGSQFNLDKTWKELWYQQRVPGDRSRTSEVLDADTSPCDELVMHSGVHTHADGIGYTTATSQKPGSVRVQVKIVALAISSLCFTCITMFCVLNKRV